jgi:hypothetical protein
MERIFLQSSLHGCQEAFLLGISCCTGLFGAQRVALPAGFEGIVPLSSPWFIEFSLYAIARVRHSISARTFKFVPKPSGPAGQRLAAAARCGYLERWAQC